MCPRATTTNVRDCCSRNPELFHPDRCGGGGAAQDGLDCGNSQLGASLKTKLDRVFALSLASTPFKVADSVVRFDSVSVVDRQPAGVGAEKGFSHQRVEGAPHRPFAIGEIGTCVSVSVDLGRQDPSRRGFRPDSVATLASATNTSEATDLVEVFPIQDRTPFFSAVTLMLHYVDSNSRGVMPPAVRAVRGLSHYSKRAPVIFRIKEVFASAL